MVKVVMMMLKNGNFDDFENGDDDGEDNDGKRIFEKAKVPRFQTDIKLVEVQVVGEALYLYNTINQNKSKLCIHFLAALAALYLTLVSE